MGDAILTATALVHFQATFRVRSVSQAWRRLNTIAATPGWVVDEPPPDLAARRRTVYRHPGIPYGHPRHGAGMVVVEDKGRTLIVNAYRCTRVRDRYREHRPSARAQATPPRR